MGNTALKKHCSTAQKTGVLNVSKSNLNEFPPQIRALHNILRNLDLSSNKFQNLPREIGLFTFLKTLTLDHNFLTEIPEEIGELTKLENLSVENNKLNVLPVSLSSLLNLKRVNLSYNEISTFPLMLCGLKHLDVIDLTRNKIMKVPNGSSGLYVTELNLNQNEVSEISEDLADCPRLKTLRIEENHVKLEDFPLKLLTNSKVSVLSVDGNLFEMKAFMNLEGYDKYMDRYTAVKKKLF